VPDADDPRPLLEQSFRQASAPVAGIEPAVMRRPTPCADFDVEALLGHLVFVAHRVAGIAKGETTADGPVIAEVADGGWSETFDVAMGEALAAWSDDDLLTAQITLPWATLPAPTEARIHALELVTHGWDLAVASGQVDVLDPELAKAVLPVAFDALPLEPRGGEMPFGPVVAVPETASAYHRLAGYTGRTA